MRNLDEVRAEAVRMSEAAWSAPAAARPEATLAAAEAYYDEDADRELRERFYGGLELPGDPRRAYEALHELVREPHRPIAYDPAKRKLHSWIDLHPNRRLRSIYSSEEVDPEVLLAVEEAIAALFAAFPEAQPPYNCEHVVPQSWFGKVEPMRGDLHHLFTCETGCNSYRSSYSFFDFADDSPTLEKCGRLDKTRNRFEPLTGKGAVARATLYFVVRYPGLVNRAGEYDMARVAMLKGWHFAFPPDEYEKRRNFTIQQTQHNRNPFVDHPDWVHGVDFEAGLG